MNTLGQSNTGGIDLHAHTTASDGSLTPTQLVRKAEALGLSALAVTDHDTVAGLDEAIAASNLSGKLELVPGVELSIEDEIGRFHMLGLLFDLANPILANTLEELRRRRSVRNEKIIEKAKELGMPLTWDDVLAQLSDGGEVVGRPHIAAAMVKKRIVGTRQEAFDKWLATDKPLYFSKHGLDATDACALLHKAGGLAFMAHPGLTKWADPDALRPILENLKAKGLDGLEVYYSLHSPEQTEAYRQIASNLGLLMSGGSDFHGDPKPTVPLGVVTDGQAADTELLVELKERLG